MEQAKQAAQETEPSKVVTQVQTPLDFVISALDKYLNDVIIGEYAQPGGMHHTHLLILTRQLLYQPYVFKTEKNTQIAVNMIMQRLSQMENIISYVVFSDIQDVSDNKRKLHVAAYMKEGTMLRYYQVDQDQNYKHFVTPKGHRDFWCQNDEKILGFSNPFHSTDITQDTDTAQVEQQIKQIKQSLRSVIQKHNKKNKNSQNQQKIEVKA